MFRLAFILACVFVSAFLSLASGDELPAAAGRKIDFVAEIQPILRRTCYSCHGAEKQESGLRLDVKARAFAGGDQGKVIVPGERASRLLTIIAGLDDKVDRMPPEGEGTPLTAEEVGAFRAWIEQGAVWPDEADGASSSTQHWSFQPIQHPPLPAVNDAAWVANAIDCFILSRLEHEQIAPSPPADRATLIRRVYLDLLGLPPTLTDVEAFVQDSRPGAYERMVERALASPHYGERWGRHWLDLARYADSDGYEKDRPRPFAWRYRSWVIEALNADLPYDQFSVLQIAGDMLPDADIESRVASGFHRNTLHNTEGGTDQEEDRVKKTVDRTNTVGSIWLGLTVGCAQCHTHKYDPLTQREYYQLYAFFNSINEADIDAPLPADEQRYQSAKAEFDREHGTLEAAVAQYEQTKLAAAQAAWEPAALQAAVIWRTIEVTAAKSKHTAKLDVQPDGSLLVTGKNVLSDVYTIETQFSGPAITAVRLEVLPDDSLVSKGPGRANNGNFVLTTFRASAAPLSGDASLVNAEFSGAQADFSQSDWEAAKAINADPNDGWAVSPHFGQRHVAVFTLKQPVGFESGTKLSIVLDQQYNQREPHNLGRFRLSVTSAAGAVSLEGLPPDVAAALGKEVSQRSAEELQKITAYFKSVDPEHRRLSQIVADHAAQAPPRGDVKAQTVAQVAEPRATNIHIRGDFLNKGEPVTAATPAVFHSLAARSAAADRLDLAQWLFAEENPLMARVTVNRVWQRIFGRGLVSTVDDFGTQGERPPHPELLDWLASEFRARGWSVKELQRLILTSHTYQQSAAARADLHDVDPDNSLLARQKRRRVESEVVRDLSLAVSGLLDSRIGGASVRPVQPAEYADLTYANSARWEVSKGGDAYRRGLYTFFQRTSPYPMLVTFDSPDSNECCALRSQSNTPLQALTLWNDPVFFETAQALGRRIASYREVSGDAEQATRDRLKFAFQLCLSRQPTAAEAEALKALFDSQLKRMQADAALRDQLVGKQPLPSGSPPDELAAWILVGRTIMNLDEFITRE